jgi:hypothetical protein
MVSGQFGDRNFGRSLWFLGWLYFQLRSALAALPVLFLVKKRSPVAIDQIVGSKLSVISHQLSVNFFGADDC